MRDCKTMCFDICTINIRVSIRVRGLHLVHLSPGQMGRTRRFSEPTFRPSGATNHWKNTVFCDFPTFLRMCIFFLLTLSLLWSSLFYSSLLSVSSHLGFSSVHIVGSLTSKLPSDIADNIVLVLHLLVLHLLVCSFGPLHFCLWPLWFQFSH